MLTALVIPASDILPVEVRELDGSLKSLQEIVGGYIQMIDTEHVQFVLNEEGKLYGMPVNDRANAYLYSIAPEWAGHDFMVGPVILLGNRGSSPTSVPASVLKDFELG